MHLLSHTMTAERFYNTLIYRIRTEEEILLIIIVSYSTELHMLAAVIIHLLVLNIVLNLIIFLCIHKILN